MHGFDAVIEADSGERVIVVTPAAILVTTVTAARPHFANSDGKRPPRRQSHRSRAGTRETMMVAHLLREKAAQCRRLIDFINDERAIRKLACMARELEEQASELDQHPEMARERDPVPRERTQRC